MLHLLHRVDPSPLASRARSLRFPFPGFRLGELLRLPAGSGAMDPRLVGHPLPIPATMSAAQLLRHPRKVGEAVHVDDIPAPKDYLYGASIYSTHPHAHIKSVNFRSSLASEKVITVISARDIPVGGKNVGSGFRMLGEEASLGDPVSEFAGQNIGIVLFFQTPPFLAPRPIGDIDQGMSQADHKILSEEVKLESQYYFYMETQTALAIPDEENCITVHASTQLPEITQNVVADCLSIPYHNVRIITRRVGGGFGGKGMKETHVLRKELEAPDFLSTSNLGKSFRP